MNFVNSTAVCLSKCAKIIFFLKKAGIEGGRIFPFSLTPKLLILSPPTTVSKGFYFQQKVGKVKTNTYICISSQTILT